jgi:hypothetical protein
LRDSKAPAADLSKLYGELWNRGVLGAGVTVAVIDTDIDSETLTLQASIARQGTANCPLGQIEPIPVGKLLSENRPQKSHGGAVISRIMQVAPAARIIHFPIFNPDAQPQDLLRALKVSIETEADVVNLSLGIPVPIDQVTTHYRDCSICRQSEAIVEEHDGLVIAAIGNWAEEAMGCPGLAPKVLSVGSIQTDEETAFYEKYPDQEVAAFLEGRSSTSYAAALISGSYALYRSAFPGIDSVTWQRIVEAGRSATNFPAYDEPDDVFKYLTEICGTDFVISQEWIRLRENGVRNRRDLLKIVDGPHPPSIAEICEWIIVQRARTREFAIAADHFARAWMGKNEQGIEQDIRIKEAGLAADILAKLSLMRMAAGAWVLRASALCNRARVLQGNQWTVNMKDAAEACQNAAAACAALAQPKTDFERAIQGSALSWGARALTLLAEIDYDANERAINDATRAIGILSALSPTVAVNKDLAHAYLHLGRAFFFRKQCYTKNRVSDSSQIVANASKALQLAASRDGYTKSEGEWLMANSA